MSSILIKKKKIFGKVVIKVNGVIQPPQKKWLQACFLLEDLKTMSNGKCNTPVVDGCLATNWRQGVPASNSWPSFATAALLEWSYFICNRQEVHLFFFSSAIFFFSSERCTPLHYRGYPQREITRALAANERLFTRKKKTPCALLRLAQTSGDFLLTEKPRVLHIYTLFFLCGFEDIWVSLRL